MLVTPKLVNDSAIHTQQHIVTPSTQGHSDIFVTWYLVAVSLTTLK